MKIVFLSGVLVGAVVLYVMLYIGDRLRHPDQVDLVFPIPQKECKR